VTLTAVLLVPAVIYVFVPSPTLSPVRLSSAAPTVDVFPHTPSRVKQPHHLLKILDSFRFFKIENLYINIRHTTLLTDKSSSLCTSVSLSLTVFAPELLNSEEPLHATITGMH